MPGSRIASIAACPRLLVACDFDGTIAPLAASPDAARADPRCLKALAGLAVLPRTAVAVISGRPLEWLRDATASIPFAMLFGCHGAEDDFLPNIQHRDEVAPTVARLSSMLRDVLPRWPGCLIEAKPFGVAVHYRRASSALSSEVIRAVRELAAMESGVTVRPGLMVIELCVSPRHKGDALARAKYRSGATHVVFFGDDVTDEDAFAALADHDLAVKVGEGATRAKTRVEEVRHVAEALELLAESRAKWAASQTLEPIQHHSVLSDQRTLAVVTPRGRITWLCLPRVDSPALFAELLGGPPAGYFDIEAEQGDPTSQVYLSDSMVLRTSWTGFTVTDYLDCSAGRAYQRAGRSDLVRSIEGRGRVRIRFAPRLDFARTATTLRLHPDGLELLEGVDPCVLCAPGLVWRVSEDGPHHTAECVIDLDAIGGSVTLELRYGTANLRPAVMPEPQRREQTVLHWAGWAGALRMPSNFRPQLIRSALTIKALTHGPTGAIAAAATTSLPEQLGGVRNWDYRFCWPRDAAMAATALMRLGNTGHAMRLADWLVGIVDRLESPERLRPIYTMSGEDLGPEAEIGGLTGYADSRPIRINNAAAQQVQLDVFGPIVDMVATMAENGVPISPDAWRLVRAMVRAVEARWEEPDHGIWEIRGPRRHHVHSKVMCWHAIDRAMVVHETVLGHPNTDWKQLRDRVGAEVLSKGWHDGVGAFTAAYESPDLDAAVLVVGLTGLLAANDPRWSATVDAIQRQLRDGPTVYRYRSDDGLPGTEGGFVICTCWLVEALATLGRFDEARTLLDTVLAQAGPTGLISEQWDPARNVALGNFPQAYSHLGVINAITRLTRLTGACG